MLVFKYDEVRTLAYKIVHSMSISQGTGKFQVGYLHQITPERRVFEKVNVDHLGLYVTTYCDNRYVFVMLDNFTKYVKLFLVSDTRK